MNKHSARRIQQIFVFSVILFAAAVSGFTEDRQFTGTIIESGAYETRHIKLRASGAMYRLDLTEEGKDVYVVVDLASGITKVVTPADQTYIETDYNNIAALAYDPFGVVRNLASRYHTETEGRETVNGLACHKKTIVNDNQPLITYWQAEALEIPVKIINHLRRDLVVELQDITPAAIDSGIFTVPQEYERTLTPWQIEEQIESRLSAVSGLATLHAPAGRRIAAGGELHLLLLPSMIAELEVENLRPDEASISITPFRDGVVVDCVGEQNHVLRKKGERKKDLFNRITLTFEEECRVDEIAVRVAKGLVYAALHQIGVDEAGVRVMEYYNGGIGSMEWMVTPSRDLEVTLIGESPDFQKNAGRIFIKNIERKLIEQQEFSLANGQSLQLAFEKNMQPTNIQVVVRKGEGGVIVHMRQPYPDDSLYRSFYLSPGQHEEEVVANRDLALKLLGRGIATEGRLVVSRERLMKQKVEEIEFSLKNREELSKYFSRDEAIRALFFSITSGFLNVSIDQRGETLQDSAPQSQ